MNPILSSYFPQSHAFIIGINQYNSLGHLHNAVNDAEGMARVLQEKVHGFTVHSPLINATYEEIRQLLEETMPSLVKEDSRLLFYFAGHGLAVDSEQAGLPEGFLLPRDALPNDDSRSISMTRVRAALEQLPCRHALLILDCCFSGAFRWSGLEKRSIAFQSVPKKIYQERFDRYVQDPAWQVLTSSSYDQEALDGYHLPLGTARNTDQAEHSPFARHLIDALRGEADVIPRDQPDGLITATELYLYIRDKLEGETITLPGNQRQTPGFFQLPKHDKGEYLFLSPKVLLNLPNYNPELNPYKGLQSYEIGDKDHFFGRDRVMKELLNFVRHHPLTIVAGASGTGKSSLVKAGLLPIMQAHHYEILQMRPGDRPQEDLRRLLPDLQFSETKKTLLLVDQFEELITQCQDEQERMSFLKSLLSLLEQEGSAGKLLLTIRSDFEPQFSDGLLKNYWQDARFAVPAFSNRELREIIERPAAERVILFDPPELVEQIMQDVQNAPGALPLLSFTMSELYEKLKERGEFGAFKLSEYQTLGGVIGSLRTRADELYRGLPPTHQRSMQKLMLRLISLEGGELSKRRVLLQELIFAEETENEAMHSILDQLTRARLLVRSQDIHGRPFVEPAHDALVRAWGTLWEWISDYGKDTLLLQHRLRNAVATYEEHDFAESVLFHNDPRLEQLKAIRHSPHNWLNKAEEAFIDKSVALKTRNRRRFITTLVSTIVVLSGLTVASVWFGLQAKSQSLRAQREARASTLAATALQRENLNPTLALHLAEAALKAQPENRSANEVLQEILSDRSRPFYSSILDGHTDIVNAVDFSPDGNLILTGSDDGTAKLWTKKGELIQNYPIYESGVLNVKFSPDGQFFLASGWEGAARLYNIDGRVLQRFYDHPYPLEWLAFSPDTPEVLLGSWGHGSIQTWDAGGRLLREFRRNEQQPAFIEDVITGTGEDIIFNNFSITRQKIRGNKEITSDEPSEAVLAFSEDGKYVITEATFHQQVHLWPGFNARRPITLYEEASGGPLASAAAFSSGNDLAAIGLHSGVLLVFNLRGDRVHTFHMTPGQWITAIAFSRDGSLIAAGNTQNTIQIWATDSGVLQYTLDGHVDNINNLSFSPDGDQMVSSTDGLENPVLIWDLKGMFEFSLTDHQADVTCAIFSPDGRSILTGSQDNSLKLWTREGYLKKTFDVETANVIAAAFSPNGQYFVAGLSDNTVMLWDTSGTAYWREDALSGFVDAVLFSPDGHTYYSGGLNGTISIWDLHAGGLIQSIPAHNDGITALNVSSKGDILLSASLDGTLKIWNKRGNFIREINTGQGYVLGADLSPDDNHILSGGFDRTVKRWTTEGKLLQTYTGFKEAVDVVCFSQDGQCFVTGNRAGIVNIWTIEGKLLQTLDHHKEGITSARFSPDNQFLLIAGSDNITTMWMLAEAYLQSDRIAHFKLEDRESYEINFDVEELLQADNMAELLDYARYFEDKYLNAGNKKSKESYYKQLELLYEKSFSDSLMDAAHPSYLRIVSDYFHKKYITDAPLKRLYAQNAIKLDNKISEFQK